MTAIERQEPVQLSQTWGANFCDYKVDGKQVDFQDLMVAVAEKRAVTVEGEVAPLSTRIRNRNTQLDALGSALADLTKVQADFASDAKGDKRSGISIANSTYDTLSNIIGGINFDNRKMLKREVEEWIQRCKSKIDGLNNQAQTDMTRLQSLVDRRDESYSTATNLMTAISDTRGNLIRNL
ncbi:MAG: hypothetical protein J6P80_00465 [Kiritimatiellae bacterium]|nr:hypothetical protein [Kiritimatiellia bacterium]